MSQTTVELHFIDGPWQGTRRMEAEEIIQRFRTYRVLIPSTLYPEEGYIVQGTALKYKKIIATEWHYIPIRLPTAFGIDRYAMILEP